MGFYCLCANLMSLGVTDIHVSLFSVCMGLKACVCVSVGYVCVCVCVYAHIYVHTRIYIYIYIHTHTHIYIYTHIYANTRMFLRRSLYLCFSFHLMLPKVLGMYSSLWFMHDVEGPFLMRNIAYVAGSLKKRRRRNENSPFSSFHDRS
jgi:hypothetical protein